MLRVYFNVIICEFHEFWVDTYCKLHILHTERMKFAAAAVHASIGGGGGGVAAVAIRTAMCEK